MQNLDMLNINFIGFSLKLYAYVRYIKVHEKVANNS